MPDSVYSIPVPVNEPIRSYAPGSAEKNELKIKISELSQQPIEIPLIINGKEVRTGKLGRCVMPHRHEHQLAVFHQAGESEVAQAIESALRAKKDWERMPWEHRAAIFLKAADLLCAPWRATLNAATMLNLSKTVYQAEIDAACELADFFRFNAWYLQKIYTDQPLNSPTIWNRVEYRPLEGFIFAVTPFNFISIGGNLPTTPVFCGNVALWKPASSAVFPAWFVMRILMEAGLPDGIINFIPGPGREVGEPVLNSPHLAGIHFTGSTATFQQMWRHIGENISHYHAYPRIIGETGGKDFIFVHASADLRASAVALIRGAFEYQGQKCSAASRAYIPQSLWNRLRKELQTLASEIKMGDPSDFTTFMGAVIDASAYRNITGYIQHAQKRPDEYTTIYGGSYNDEEGYFIEPNIIQAINPQAKLMTEEIFGPVLTLYVYPDEHYVETLELCNRTSPYGLTGAILANDRTAILQAETILRHAAGNFYINDKPTGAVVGQQPFGGGRASGTNDKAGSYMNMLRWISARAIKENFSTPKQLIYPSMLES